MRGRGRGRQVELVSITYDYDFRYFLLVDEQERMTIPRTEREKRKRLLSAATMDDIYCGETGNSFNNCSYTIKARDDIGSWKSTLIIACNPKPGELQTSNLFIWCYFQLPWERSSFLPKPKRV